MSDFALLLKIRLDEMFEVSATFRQNQNSKKIGMICHHMVMVILYGILFGMVYFLADYLRVQSL